MSGCAWMTLCVDNRYVRACLDDTLPGRWICRGVLGWHSAWTMDMSGHAWMTLPGQPMSGRSWMTLYLDNPYVRAYLDDTLPGRRIGRRGAIEYPPRSPDLTPLDFYLWGTLKDEVYQQRPATLNALRETMCSHHTRHTYSRSSAASTLFSRWWWSLTPSPRKNCSYMSLCSRNIDYHRVSTFFLCPSATLRPTSRNGGSS
jgi:hypothetical protein